MKKAVIVGAAGQDGRLLFEALRRDGYALIGIDLGRLRSADVRFRTPVRIRRSAEVRRLIRRFQPAEVYYLAARHRSAEGKDPHGDDLLEESYDVHVLGLLNFLEAIRRHSPRTRLFYASSSLVFGAAKGGHFDETSPLRPDEIYGVTKALGMSLCRFYRRRHAVFAAAGILFNHESPLRADAFVSRKIVRGAADIRAGRRRVLALGDPRAQADWGYAPDYVDAMRRILRRPRPDDFVVATGKKHTVGEFARLVFTRLGLDAKKHLRADRRLLTRRAAARSGDARKLRRLTGWKPSVDFHGLIDKLLEAETGRA